MLVTIASLQQPTFRSEISWPRTNGQSITAYVAQELEIRVRYVSERIETAAIAALEQYPERRCLFFTLPEFFWNVPWSQVENEEELQELTTAYLNSMPACMNELMSRLPQSRFGKIMLLAGTCATLVKVGEGSSSYFDVVNYLLACSNFQLQADGSPSLSMWPKRHVSGIDFGQNLRSVRGYWFFKLADGFVVKVNQTSSAIAEHNDAQNYGPGFSNGWLPGATFSINLCLDYAVLEPGERNEEWEATDSVIDFLIACGMSFETDGRIYPDSVRFAVRNDGMGKGKCEFARVKGGKIVGYLPSTMIDETLHLAVLNLA